MNQDLQEKKDIRDRIIEVAGEIFAEKGYQNTTVRDICQKANTYQLSINYHFGSKENLFKEVLLKTYQDTLEANLIERIKDLPLEKQLEEIIATRVKSIFSKGRDGIHFRIILKEIPQNYNLVVETMRNPLLNYLEEVKKVIWNLSDRKLHDFGLNYCASLIVSHIAVLSMHEKARVLLFDTKNPDEKQLEKFINYTKNFVLAGIEKMKHEDIL
ncbi:MAG: TetR/AcrR family transcriptional regulator [Candidatus Gastranaerophilales bacterium]|nr:TetR/AcrR family transcriptional regulator [Candidatus Gastranaerophilales bacterium]